MTTPTRWKLASALIAAGLYDLADRAVSGWYDDFLSPLALPAMTLAAELERIGTPEALYVRGQVIAGEFDATEAEANAWAASPEGRKAFAQLLRPH